MSKFPLCSEFIPFFDQLKQTLKELKNLSVDYIKLGTEDLKNLCLQKSQEIKDLKQTLENLENQPAEFQGNSIKRMEKELLNFLCSKLKKDLRYEIKNNVILKIDIRKSGKNNNILQSTLKYLKLFSSLLYLDCSYTQITKIPPLPDSLRRLDCEHTQITELPQLPGGLRLLSCGRTKISKLPKLPVGLEQLSCYGTQITSLHELPDSLKFLDYANTPASENSQVRKSLEPFKKDHPQFKIVR